jgi:uncharacterized protein
MKSLIHSLLGVVVIGDVCFAQKPQIVTGTMKIYGNDSYPVTMRRLQPIDSPRARYPGFKPSTMILKKGSIRRGGVKPLPVDMVFERDVAVKLRDGLTMYMDIFRPVGNETVPGIIGWGAYGKEYGGQHLDDAGRVGIPKSRLSDFQKFESADPGYWVEKGYAVLNPDSRGAYWSEGKFGAYAFLIFYIEGTLGT